MKEIKIAKSSLGDFMVYIVTKNSETKETSETLEGIYNTRKKLNSCVSRCLGVLASEYDKG